MLEVTKRSKLKRYAERAAYSREAVNRVLDSCFVCYVAYLPVGLKTPICIPQGCVRDGDFLLLHGKTSSALMKHLKAGHEVCVTAATMNGVVCAKNAFDHSMNYDSVVLFGAAEEVEKPLEKARSMEAITDALTYEGRYQKLRPVLDSEVKATTIVRIKLTEACVKTRDGQTGQTEEYPVWSGVIPLERVQGAPVSDAISVKQRLTPPNTCLYKNKQVRAAFRSQSTGLEWKSLGVGFIIGCASLFAVTLCQQSRTP